MNRRGFGDIIGALIIVAIVYVLVRPHSAGVELVAAVGGLFESMVRNAIDLGSGGNGE